MNIEEYKTFIKHWTLVLELARDVADFTGEEELAVSEKMRSCTETLRDKWGEHTGTAEAFYHGNDTYLYDLVDFNGTASYFKYRLAPIASVHEGRILDIGCGIGTATFLLAEENTVTGYDINERLIDFCEFRKERYNLSGQFTTELPDFSIFSHIIAIDTLEHIEDLRGFISKMGECSKGTMFYHYDCFNNQDVSPMHFDHSSEIDSFLKDAGFDILHPTYARKTAKNKVSIASSP